MSNRRNGKECLVDSEIAEGIKNGKQYRLALANKSYFS